MDLRRFSWIAAATAAAFAATAQAQDPASGSSTTWPNKTVRLIIPFSPGGSTDFQGRILCDAMTKTFGQSFVIDHKPGDRKSVV